MQEQTEPSLDWFLAMLEERLPGFRQCDDVVKKTAIQIWRRRRSPCTIDEIVAALPCTRRTIERRIRRQLACSVNDMIALGRLEHAKWLLVNSSHSVRMIAAQSGFSSSDWLGKVIRRSTGLTPCEYRRLATPPDRGPNPT